MKKCNSRLTEWHKYFLTGGGITSFTSALLIVFLLSKCTCNVTSAEKIKPRIIVTCDPEEDDQNSLIRFLLYRTDFKIDGLIYNASEHYWKGDGYEWIKEDHFGYYL